MTKTLAFIAAALLLNGCSGAINHNSPQASGTIEDLTQSKYKASGDLEAESAEAKLVSCDDHTQPDSRLTEGTTITETKTSAKLGQGILKTDGVFEVKKNDGGVLSMTNTFTRAGATYVRDENCSNSEKNGFQCVLAKDEGKAFSAGNYCNITPSGDAVVTYEKGEASADNTLGIKTFVVVTTTQQGTINCHGKDQAPGFSVSKVVYSADMPSTNSDGCSYGEVYKNVKLLNADRTVRETQAREVTAVNYRLVL